jgi:hypothetical protein
MTQVPIILKEVAVGTWKGNTNIKFRCVWLLIKIGNYVPPVPFDSLSLTGYPVSTQKVRISVKHAMNEALVKPKILLDLSRQNAAD